MSLLTSSRTRKAAAALGVSGLLAFAVGCGSAQTTTAASASGQPPGGAQSQQGQQAPQGAQGQPGRGMRGGPPDLAAIAKELGVSQSDLQQAMQAARPDPSATTRTDPATKIARQLGLDAAKVRKVLQAHRPAGGPPQGPMGQQGGGPGQNGMAPGGAGAQTS